jgi:hypothetical protein
LAKHDAARQLFSIFPFAKMNHRREGSRPDGNDGGKALVSEKLHGQILPVREKFEREEKKWLPRKKKSQH